MKKIARIVLDILNYIYPAVFFSMAYFFDIQGDLNAGGPGAYSYVFSTIVMAWLLAVIPIAGNMTRYGGLKASGSQLYNLHLATGAITALITLAAFMTTPNQYYFGLSLVVVITIIMNRLLKKYGVLKPGLKWYQ